MSSPISRLALFLLLLVWSAMFMVGSAHFAGITAAQALALYGAILPWLTVIAILLFRDWLWEYIVGTWGIWEARKDLRLLAHDLSIVETWRMGGRMGIRAFLALFFLTVAVVAGFGVAFLTASVQILLKQNPPSLDWNHGISNILVFVLLPSWVLYGTYLLFWRWKFPRPNLPQEAIPAVASIAAWQKQGYLNNKEEAVAFLSLLQTACPEFTSPRSFPWKVLFFSLPAFSWHFYLWAGGQTAFPLAVSASIGLLGAASVFILLWWLVPWTIAQTRSLLAPEQTPVCRYPPIIRLWQLAESLARIA
ncbi:hypothetical protein HHS34_005505 [Acidithiobacillus montserratensis]|uniref:Uncharacterized protein n=1 Tax=Acidithiobacillus montserratensis TaxID=2729135 RepID=A0ACD5HIM8_9PROT